MHHNIDAVGTRVRLHYSIDVMAEISCIKGQWYVISLSLFSVLLNMFCFLTWKCEEYLVSNNRELWQFLRKLCTKEKLNLKGNDMHSHHYDITHSDEIITARIYGYFNCRPDWVAIEMIYLYGRRRPLCVFISLKTKCATELMCSGKNYQ